MKNNKTDSKNLVSPQSAPSAPSTNTGEAASSPSVKNDVIEIPIGRYFSKFRNNPWIVATFVLAIVVVYLLFSRGGVSDNPVTGDVVTGDVAAKQLISFINSQGKGNADLVSSEKEGALYKVTVNYQGQDVPVYTTLDGKYLVVQPIPLSGDLPQQPNTEEVAPNNLEKIDVKTEGSPSKGNSNATVTIVEFTDYQCPFCAKFYSETYPQILKEYIDTGKARIVLKDFPLNFHENAQKAAESARCVRDQKGDEGYFKMHDKLFQNQGSLSLENIKKWAKELGVDSAKFDTCLDSGKFEKAVKDDLSYGQEIGVSGTPAFFINGKLIEGAQPFSVFKQMIDEELNGAT